VSTSCYADDEVALNASRLRHVGAAPGGLDSSSTWECHVSAPHSKWSQHLSRIGEIPAEWCFELGHSGFRLFLSCGS
jgi:hypothetical protein